MRTIILALALAACTTEPMPGATPGTALAAAEEIAAVACQRFIDCDPDYTLTLEKCIEYKAPNYCKQIGCDTPYEPSAELEDCIDAFAAASCGAVPLSCEL